MKITSMSTKPSNPFASSSGSFSDDEREDDNRTTEQIIERRKQVNTSSLESSRRSKQRILQTEQIAAQTLEQLDMQGEQLRMAAHTLDSVNRHAESADYQARELKRLKKFVPWAWGKDKRDREEAVRREQQRRADMQLEEHKHAREVRRNKILAQQQVQHHSSSKREPQIASNGKSQNRSRSSSAESVRSSGSASKSSAQRPSRHNMTESDEELEKELSSNLKDIGRAVRGLKLAAAAMNEELESQTQTIDRLKSSTDTAGVKIASVNNKIKRYA